MKPKLRDKTQRVYTNISFSAIRPKNFAQNGQINFCRQFCDYILLLFVEFEITLV
jgi:hypothetical protein